MRALLRLRCLALLHLYCICVKKFGNYCVCIYKIIILIQITKKIFKNKNEL